MFDDCGQTGNAVLLLKHFLVLSFVFPIVPICLFYSFLKLGMKVLVNGFFVFASLFILYVLAQ